METRQEAHRNSHRKEGVGTDRREWADGGVSQCRKRPRNRIHQCQPVDTTPPPTPPSRSAPNIVRNPHRSELLSKKAIDRFVMPIALIPGRPPGLANALRAARLADMAGKSAEAGLAFVALILSLMVTPSANGQPPRHEPEAFASLRARAEGGDAEAAYLVGVALDCGYSGAPTNRAEAVQWYRVAAARSSTAAQVALGMCYLLGEGLTKNGAEAAKWLRPCPIQAGTLPPPRHRNPQGRAQGGFAAARLGGKRRGQSPGHPRKLLLSRDRSTQGRSDDPRFQAAPPTGVWWL